MVGGDVPDEGRMTMPAFDDDIPQAEKRRVVLQDADVQRQQQQAQGSTFKAFADADANIPGRFASVAASHVVGSTATPKYPAASTPFQRDPVPPEPPTGYDINEMPPLDPRPASSDVPLAAPDDPAAAPSSPSSPTPVGELDVERAGPPFSQRGDDQ